MITHGVIRDSTYVWNFITVSERVDVILIDIKQAVRAGFTLVADAAAATLLRSNSPYTPVLTGAVNPNGSYEWDFLQVLNLRNPLPEWFSSTRVPSLLSTWLPSPGDILTTSNGVVKRARISEKKASSRYGIGFDPKQQTSLQIESHQKQTAFLRHLLREGYTVTVDSPTDLRRNNSTPNILTGTHTSGTSYLDHPRTTHIRSTS